MKVRVRHRFRRIWLTSAIVGIGILAGYLVGRETILRSTNSRLGNFAGLILSQDEETATEITEILRQADASTYPPCAVQDVVALRRLTFQARFLKDVARVQDQEIRCSAASGKFAVPLSSIKPEITLPAGHAVYLSYPLGGARKDSGLLIAYHSAAVVVSPDAFSSVQQAPLHYAVEVKNRVSGGLLSLGIDTGSVPPALINRQAGQQTLVERKLIRAGANFYEARCSARFPFCIISYVAAKELWQSSHGLLYSYLVTGGLAGVICALALWMAGSKTLSPTNQLKRAILMGKLTLVYQPIVELSSHQIIGAEALARWTDDQGDSIRPETIIALAEAEGFVSDITRFVLTRALEELAPIFECRPDFHLSINLAPSDLTDPRLLLLLDEKLADASITAANVGFELSERATLDREIAIASIRRLRDRGHTVFIDDFGTGYSNLTYLTELNVDGIKINRSFIATIGTDSVTATIVPQILAVARALKLKVVVQGIERLEQAEYFATDDLGIKGQGWFFGMPVAARSLLYLCAEKVE